MNIYFVFRYTTEYKNRIKYKKQYWWSGLYVIAYLGHELRTTGKGLTRVRTRKGVTIGGRFSFEKQRNWQKSLIGVAIRSAEKCDHGK